MSDILNKMLVVTENLLNTPHKALKVLHVVSSS